MISRTFALLCALVLQTSFVSHAAWLNGTAAPAEADYVSIQFPSSVTSSNGLSPLIYGRIYEAGLTEATGPNAAVIAQVGYGPLGSDPRFSSDWSWQPAAYNVQVGNNDEYQGAIAFSDNGSFSYAYRFSVNGGVDWTAADLDGAGSNAGLSFSAANLGTAFVSGVPPRILIRRTITNAVALSWTPATNSYYVIYRGLEVTNVTAPVAVVFSTNTVAEIIQPLTNAMAFFVLREVPVGAPLDLDHDGMTDVFELRYPTCLDPLNGADASADCDGDGISNLAEFASGTDPTVANGSATGLVINEVDYDSVGNDSFEFLEILNTTSNSINLAAISVVLINGNGNAEYGRISLAPLGSVPAGGYIVIANTNVVVPGSASVLRIPDNTIQNGAPDGIALFDFARHVIVDALSYEGSITAAAIAGEGSFSLVEGTVLAGAIADSNVAAGSLVRFPNGQDTNDANSDWRFSSTPTPGAANTGP